MFNVCIGKNPSIPYLISTYRKYDWGKTLNNAKLLLNFFIQYCPCQNIETLKFFTIILEHLIHLGFDVESILSKNQQEQLPEDIG